MATECTQKDFGFHPLKHREIRAQFDGGAITTEGGGLLLREVEKRIGMVRQFAACFRDYRKVDLIEHTVEELVAQRIYGLALGYEDLNDHEEFRPRAPSRSYAGACRRAGRQISMITFGPLQEPDFEPRFRPDPGALLHRVSRQSFTPARGTCLREIGEWASCRRERVQVRRPTA